MTMKLDVSDSQSNHSEVSDDSQSSQGSSNDYMSTIQASRSLLSILSAHAAVSGAFRIHRRSTPHPSGESTETSEIH